MPAYGTISPPIALYPGSFQNVWNADSPATGDSSERVGLAAVPFGELSSISIALSFSGDPGTFQVDVQDADSDDAASFGANGSVLGSITSVTAQANGTYTARFEVQCRGNFVRLKMKTAPSNVVTTTARISR